MREISKKIHEELDYPEFWDQFVWCRPNYSLFQTNHINNNNTMKQSTFFFALAVILFFSTCEARLKLDSNSTTNKRALTLETISSAMAYIRFLTQEECERVVEHWSNAPGGFFFFFFFFSLSFFLIYFQLIRYLCLERYVHCQQLYSFVNK